MATMVEMGRLICYYLLSRARDSWHTLRCHRPPHGPATQGLGAGFGARLPLVQVWPFGVKRLNRNIITSYRWLTSMVMLTDLALVTRDNRLFNDST